MTNINFLKPDKSNLNTFLYLGSFLFFVSILDVFLNSFFKELLIELNITRQGDAKSGCEVPRSPN